ncbi:substrate-binding domain-containing protein [Arcanobacterium hippocoleae]
MLANVHDSAAQEWNAANELVSRGIDFLVVLMSSIPDSQWREAKFPVPVAMMDRQRELPGFLTVGADFIDGGVKCTQHLIAHGRRQIVPVFGEFTRGDENNRYTGYLQAVKDASLPAVTPIICEWNMDGGYQAGIEYLSRGGVDYADGIFCFSDSIAFGFLRALRENNVHIPEQAALIGFDGIGLGKYAAPALATLAQPIHEMVDFIVRILVAESGAELPSGLQKFPVKLVPAASCGCI